MHADSFHRLVKVIADSGEAGSIADALDTFSRYGVRIHLGPRVARLASAQIIALTVINSAARCFQGNVSVVGEDFELTARGFERLKLSKFLDWVGVKKSLPSDNVTWPTIAIECEHEMPGAIRPWADGWNFGLGRPASAENAFVPACVAAAGLAVSEGFSILRGDNPYAGRRALSMSLWDPRPVDSSAVDPAGTRQTVPAQEGVWMVGLGHLGQAYAWTLGFMEPGSAPIMLQDVDTITPSSVSTSMLCTEADAGQMKTRVAARWLEARGYRTSIVERRFDGYQRVSAGEPAVALFGVDNPAARRVMEGAGFRLVIDAGLGSGYHDFRAIRMRTFPGPSAADSLWAVSPAVAVKELPVAYRRLLADGAEPCGVTTLASRAVGAPFVGCVAAGFVLAERVRRQLGKSGLAYVDLNLRDPLQMDCG